MGASPYLSHLPLTDVSSPHQIDNARRGGLNAPHSRGSLRLPRAVFWRPCRALIPIANRQRPPWRASFPLAIYGEGVAVRPGVRSFPSLAFKPLDRAIVRLFLVVANAD